MTTICVRRYKNETPEFPAGTILFAADSMTTNNHMKTGGSSKKLIQINGITFGMAGSQYLKVLFSEFVEELDADSIIVRGITRTGMMRLLSKFYGYIKELDADISAGTSILMAKGAKIFHAGIDKDGVFVDEVDEFFAIGSGQAYAMGAMAAGLSPVEAVIASIKIDVWSGLPVTICPHHP